MARIDKAGIYIDAQHLFRALYDAQFKMPKKDRCVLAPRLLDHCEKMLAAFSLAYSVENEYKRHHIDTMMAEYEMLKMECRFAVDSYLVNDTDVIKEIMEYVVRISEGISKWRQYISTIGK